MAKQESSENVFAEYSAFLAQISRVKETQGLTQEMLMMEYLKLAEKYETLLKSASRVAKMGDMAQRKLLKFKELFDTMRDID